MTEAKSKSQEKHQDNMAEQQRAKKKVTWGERESWSEYQDEITRPK